MKSFKEIREAKDPARTVSQLAIRDTNKRFDRAKKSAEKDDENSKYRTSKSGNVFVGLKKEAKDPGEYDNEGAMAKTQLKGILADAEHMIKMFEDDQNLPEWVQNKITKAADYLNSAHRYMMNDDDAQNESATNMRNLKLINRIKKSGTVKSGSMSKDSK